jgi:hypothetical protein
VHENECPVHTPQYPVHENECPVLKHQCTFHRPESENHAKIQLNTTLIKIC